MKNALAKIRRKVVKRIGRLKIVRRLLKSSMFGWYLPQAYAKAAKEPINPKKVVFVQQVAWELSDSFRVVHERLKKEYDFELKIVYLRQTSVSVFRYYYNCRKMLKEVATAKYVFLNESSTAISSVDLKKETKIIQLWHACGAFKKFGMSTADLIFGGTRAEQLRHPHYKYCDLVTVSSPEVIWAYAEAMVLEDRQEVIKPLGVSRTDVFFDPYFLETAQSEAAAFAPPSVGKKIILYAPTFRGRTGGAKAPNELDIPALKTALGNEYVLLIKHHHLVKRKPPIPEGCEDFAFLVEDELSIDMLLSVADICISDYSSLIFEYALFERPMIFFAYDVEEFNDWRSFYYPYEEMTPGPIFTTTSEIIEYIKNIDELFDKQEVIDFKQKFMSSCDGNATQRILEEVFGAELERHRKPNALSILREKSPQGKDVSIIVPAHNAMPELTKALESLTEQSYPLERIEAIVVDDGSSDDTWKEIQRFCAAHPQMFVAKQFEKASGSPAAPRNAALDLATGEYIYFLDADDWLGKQAVEKALNHAVEWNSDVLYTKMVGVNGRVPPRSMFRRNKAAARLFGSNILWSLGPLKLFRRSLIEDNKLRFFEKGMPEDSCLVLQALLSAQVISIASDYGYYYCGWRGDVEQNTFSSIWNDLDANMVAFTELLAIIDERISKSDREIILMRRLFESEVFPMFESLIERYPAEQWSEYGKRITELFAPYYTEAVSSKIKAEKRIVLEAGLSGNYDLLKVVVGRGHEMLEQYSFFVDDGKLMAAYVHKGESFVYDVSSGVVLACQVDSLVHDDDASMTLVGQIRTNMAYLPNTPAAAVVFRQEESGAEVIFDCLPLTVGEKEYETEYPKLRWACTCDFNEVEACGIRENVGAKTAVEIAEADEAAEPQPVLWSLYLRVSVGDFKKDVRLGIQSSNFARKRFTTIDKKTETGKEYQPHPINKSRFKGAFGYEEKEQA